MPRPSCRHLLGNNLSISLQCIVHPCTVVRNLIRHVQTKWYKMDMHECSHEDEQKGFLIGWYFASMYDQNTYMNRKDFCLTRELLLRMVIGRKKSFEIYLSPCPKHLFFCRLCADSQQHTDVYFASNKSKILVVLAKAMALSQS